MTTPCEEGLRALTKRPDTSASGDHDPAVAALIELARPARAISAFTGAGISTESGIPDYRGPGGVWERNAPPTLSDFRENPETRRQYWVERRERYPALRDTEPNAGHLALARLQSAGRLSHVITQNIDGSASEGRERPRAHDRTAWNGAPGALSRLWRIMAGGPDPGPARARATAQL